MRKVIIAIFTCCALSSCVDFDDATGPVTVKIQVVMPEGFNGADVSGKTVTITLGSQDITAQTDNEGIVTFQNIVPDNYDISTSWKMTGEEYAALIGGHVENSTYTVSGSLNSKLLTQNSQLLTLTTTVQKDQSLLIGKVYYEGSKDVNNRNYVAGKYMEIYNNSAETVDVAGLYIALTETESTIAYTPGQVEETIFAKQVFRIPATTAVNIAPGGTLLLVNSAIDHTLTAQNDYERNLLDADFEAKDNQGKTTNNPDTPALELIYTSYSTLSYMNLVQGGPASVVIFTTGEDVSQWPRVYAYGKTKGNMFMQIPTSVIIDGVEILKNRSQTGPDINTKRLFDYIDAGYAYCSSASGYSGEVVCRKTAGITDDGRRVLQDTNNSLNDFTTSTTLSPREYQ
mgnify:CR=1 FL=1